MALTDTQLQTLSDELDTDPQFINPGGTTPEDYRIKRTSPAVDIGPPVGISQDYFGNPVQG